MQNDQLKQRPGSCDISIPETQEKKTGMEQLSPERIEEMKAYARKLRLKNPKMKPDRLKRKVADYFNITLV